MSYQPVIIIGAPRSGTNMLRDVLTRLPGFHTWPCDEINYVWKHGNLGHDDDLLTPDLIKPCTRRFVASQFAGQARECGASFVVEKTCANSLRVPFVDALVPDARYIVLLRSGPDAIASTIKRWQNPASSWRYLWQKFKFVAGSDRPRVLAQVVFRRLAGLFGRSEIAWSTWGPTFPELEDALIAGRPLDEICALQWSRCVERSLMDLENLDPARRQYIKYEDFVSDPEQNLQRILTWLEAPVPAKDIASAVSSVSRASVGKSSSSLDEESLARLGPIISEAGVRMKQVLESVRPLD